mmetsp:Transcript_3924/g.3284  ORF Transcript_3924/g.3284 Transcript_3924/m.3284 type:complete len:124 (+) Transcript_3924:139-510(+)
MEHRITSEVSLKEILPYYGYLDEAYVLALMMNKRSNQKIKDTKRYTCTKAGFERRVSKVQIKEARSLLKQKCKNPYSLDLFLTPEIILKNKGEIRKFNKLLQNLDENTLLKFSRVVVALHPNQ